MGGPVFVVVCGNVLLCSKLRRILLLRSGSAYGSNAVSSESLRAGQSFFILTEEVNSTLA